MLACHPPGIKSRSAQAGPAFKTTDDTGDRRSKETSQVFPGQTPLPVGSDECVKTSVDPSLWNPRKNPLPPARQPPIFSYRFSQTCPKSGLTRLCPPPDGSKTRITLRSKRGDPRKSPS